MCFFNLLTGERQLHICHTKYKNITFHFSLISPAEEHAINAIKSKVMSMSLGVCVCVFLSHTHTVSEIGLICRDKTERH